MTSKRVFLLGLVTGFALLAGQGAEALPLAGSAQSLISDNAMSGIRGSTMTNVAAGNGNLQANVANIIMSSNGQGAETLNGKVVQAGQADSGNAYHRQQTSISGNSFANSVGTLAINQAAGSSNAESNQLNVVIGTLKPVSNQILSQSLTGPNTTGSGEGKTGGSMAQVSVSADAFKGAGGIAQVNQISGSGNAAANSFALGVTPGVMQ